MMGNNDVVVDRFGDIFRAPFAPVSNAEHHHRGRRRWRRCHHLGEMDEEAEVEEVVVVAVLVVTIIIIRVTEAAGTHRQGPPRRPAL